MKGAGGGRVVGVLQFAPNSKEELQTEEDTEEKDQWALMISLPATLLDFYFSGGRGCHGDKYSWLNKAYREKWREGRERKESAAGGRLRPSNKRTDMHQRRSELSKKDFTDQSTGKKYTSLLFLLLPALLQDVPWPHIQFISP